MSQMTEQQLYINGSYISATSGRIPETTNPVTGEVLATVQTAGREDVGRAVENTQHGQKIWVIMTAMECPRILRRATDLLRQHNDKLVRLEMLDISKPLSETVAVDIVTGADVLEYYTGLTSALEDSQIPLCDSSLVYIHRESPGVIVGVSTWNYPIQIVLRESTPALAADSAMIFKPSEVTPLAALKLAEICNETNLSDGVLNVLSGIGAEIDQYLTEHPGTTRISLTGGVASGKKVMANSAASPLEEVTMELDGRSPLIVADDADLDLAAGIVMMANFYSSDQVCTNGIRAFVLVKRKAEFEHKILERVDCIRPGNLLADDTNFGLLISFPHHDNVLRYIKGGEREGAHLLCDGEMLKDDGFDNGAWVAPTVFIDCNDEMTTVYEETSGPVMSILSCTDEAETIRRVNAIECGLAAGVVMPGLNRTRCLIHQPEVDIYWINSWGESPAEVLAGGYKHSGIGRENGVMTLQSYTQMKSIQAETGKFRSIS